MLRRFSYTLVMCTLVAITAYFMTKSNEAADPVPPQDAKSSQNAKSSDEEAKSSPETDPFAVPEGDDEQALILFLQRIVQTPAEESTPDAVVKHLHKIDKAIGEVLTRKISDELYVSVAEVRLEIYGILPELGDKTVKAKKEAFLKKLKENPKPAVQNMVKRLGFQERIEKLASDDQAAQQALVNDVAKMIEETPKEDNENLLLGVQMAMSIGRTLERLNSSLTVSTYKRFIKAIDSRHNKDLERVVSIMSGIVRRLDLPGKPIEVSGNTVAGQEFNIDQYKGKVVLVDFWATWCPPCLAELPHLQKIYDDYHSKGLEIVGISLDNDKETLQAFLDKREIKWANLFEDGKESGWDNSIAAHYGISALPSMILVDRDGKVASVHVGGFDPESTEPNQLETDVRKLLGITDQSESEKPKDEKPKDEKLDPPAEK